MKQRRPRFKKIIIGITAISVMIGTMAFFTRTKEPTSNGHTLSHWVAVHGGSSPQPKPTKQQREEAAEAIRAIGTNGLPLLLAWLDYEPSRLDRWLIQKAHYFPATVSGGLERSHSASAAITALGPLAVSAIPELHRLVSRTNARQTSVAALTTLSKLGPAAVSVITNILATPPYNENPLWTLYTLENMGTNAVAALPVLLQHLKNTNEAIATAGATCLAHLHLEADQTVPALAEALGDPRAGIRKIAAEGLGKFGPLARSALPALTTALEDPDAVVRKNASAAIKMVTKDTPQ